MEPTPKKKAPVRPRGCRILRVASLCALSGGLAGLLHAALFFGRAGLYLWTDFFSILSYAAALAALLATLLGLPVALLFRRREKVLNWLPAAMLALFLFAFPGAEEASSDYLKVHMARPVEWASSILKVVLWAGMSVGSAFLFRWGVKGRTRRILLPLSPLLLALPAYLLLRNPQWRDPLKHDASLDRYPHPVQPRPAAPLLVFALDGVDWELMDSAIRAGRMPHCARLIACGARAVLKSEAPLVSHRCWTSIFTGKTPLRHGVRRHLVVSLPGTSHVRPHFRDRDNLLFLGLVGLGVEAGLIEAPPTPSGVLQSKPLWKVLSDHHRDVWVLGMPATWPAFPVQGVMVTDRTYYSVWECFFRHRERIERGTFPPELAQEIEPLVRRPWRVSREEVARFYEPTPEDLEAIRRDSMNLIWPDRRVLFNRTYGMDVTVLDVFDHLAGRRPLPDLAVLYLTGADFAAHVFYQHKFPERYPPGFSPPEEISRFRETIDRYLQFLDERIGRIVERYGEQATVVLVSDHGNSPTPDRRIWPAYHSVDGIFAIRGPGIRAGATMEPISLYDVAPTLYAACGFPVPQDADGRCRGEVFVSPEGIATIPSYDP